MKLRGLAAAILVLAVGSAAGAREPFDDYVGAMTNTASWLKVVDAGKWGESWDASAALFRSAMSRDDWKKAVSAARGPLGKVLSRKLKTAERKTSLPGAPDGEYIVVQFDTSFEKKKAAVETVTPMLDADGTWRVSGYFIR